MINKNSSLDFIKFYEVSDQQREELKKWSLLEVNNDDSVPKFMNDIVSEFKQNFRAIHIKFESKSDKSFFTYQELHQLSSKIVHLLGDLLIQNEQGDRVVLVYDRDRNSSMYTGSRYHQTREGGSIHTDNVNTPEIWDYLYLSCLSPALVGGENIIVDGQQIYEELKQYYPDALAILEAPFIWEMRGLKDSTYEAPIITYNDRNEPLFRHLRPYMESAHRKVNRPLTSEQLYSIDILDALLNCSNFQMRVEMGKGDILISKDAQVFHGRACFSDHIEAVSYDEYISGKGTILKRTMERVWAKEK